MRKKTETAIVRRNGRYMVIIRQYRSIFGFRIWEDVWRETPPRFISKAMAAEMENNIDKYLKGKYTPICSR